MTGEQMTFADIFERVSPSVVTVTAIIVEPYRLTNRVTPSLGTGFVVEPGGMIVTNSHVVHGARQLSVQTRNGEFIAVELAGADPVLDVAALRMRAPPANLPALQLGDSDALRIGDEVMAIGNAWVSARQRRAALFRASTACFLFRP